MKFQKSLISLALASVSVSALAADPNKAIEDRIDALSQQVQTLQAEVQKLKAQNEALAAQQEQQTQPQAASAAASATPASEVLDRASIWGYGEIYYDRPIHHPDDTTADLARAVVGVGYRFDERTRFNSEFEIEHAVASADDSGEVEVEQFWVDHQINNQLAIKGGLFLMPAAYINQSHEPTNFYGVHRNFVETLIIPSTWREGGAALHGSTDSGLSWEGGVTTAINIANWDFFAEQPLALEDKAPLQATHQELQNANAAHLQQYAALNWNGIPGYNLGASVYTGKSVNVASHLPDPRFTLWEAHTRWKPGKLDLSAVYARGTISDTGVANATAPGTENPIPSSFFGYYAQAAYQLWQRGDQRLAPFARWERFNLGKSYEGLVSTSTVGPLETETAWTFGLNYWLNSHVVVKADYQKFDLDDALDRWDLGFGVSF